MKGVFHRIRLPRQWDSKPSVKVPQRVCIGYDTETTPDGDADILADGSRWIAPASTLDTLQFLAHKGNRNTIGLFYNMGFDFPALFKREGDFCRQVVAEGEAQLHGYDITYIEKKCLAIREHGRRHQFFDISQFYEGTKASLPGYNGGEPFYGLAAASWVYLKREPHAFKALRAGLYATHSQAERGDYCVDDARNTGDLGNLLTASLNGQGLKANRLYSAGYIAQQYALAYADVPTARDVPYIVNRLYHEAYRGGWFDCYKHGKFTATSYDLKSAYPWALRQLPDIRLGDWVRGDTTGDVGVMQCVIKGGARFGQPIAVKVAGRNIYPTLDTPYRTCITLAEYRVLARDFEIKPLLSYSFMPRGRPIYPYTGLLERLFKEKSSHAPDDARYLLAKRIMNSFYGKSAELRKEGLGWRAGRMFNPCYAAETTARVRMKLYEAIKGREHHVVSILTDGLVFDSAEQLPTGKELGDWEAKHQAHECVTLASGIYEYLGSDRATRGFSRQNSLYKILDTEDAAVTVTPRPTKLREAIVQNRLGDACIFTDAVRVLNLHSDVKRLWPAQPRVPRDLLQRSFDSVPQSLSSLKSFARVV